MTSPATALRPPSPVSDAAPATRGRRLRRWWYPLVVVALLGQMAVAMLTAAVQQTPTIDEPVYVGTAVVYLQQDSLRYNPEHPPLGKLLIGLGLALDQPRIDPTFAGSQEDLGRHVLYEAGNDPWRLMLLARLPVIALTLLFGLVVLAFAVDLVGRAGGLVALALYACSPDLIAHGSLATLDVAAAGFLFTSVWLLWRARRRPTRYLPLAGLALGAALAVKMSALAAVPVLLGLAVISVRQAVQSRGSGVRRPMPPLLLGLAAAVGMGLLAVAVVWASYLAVDPRLRWTPPGDVSDAGGLRGLLLAGLPFPAPYLDGMRVQFGFEGSRFGGFLFGRQYVGSLWYYLPAAVLVKTPLGMLALWLAGTAAMLAIPKLRTAAAYLLVPTLVLLAAAMAGSRDFGVRYAIFLPVFLAVVASAVVAVRHRWAGPAAVALVLLVALSSARAYPYHLAYANEAFGGPARTHLLLHDSNVDWGQDLGRLADRLRDRYPDDPVWLVYKGSGEPSAYGIEAADPLAVPPDRVRGLLAVSNSSIARADDRLAALLDGATRVDSVGHSITIFRRG